MEPRRLGRESRGRRSRSRTIPIPGDETGEGEGNWYRCHSCGMHCNDVTDTVDDGASKVRISHMLVADQAIMVIGSKIAVNFLYSTGQTPLSKVYVALADSNGNAKQVVRKHYITDTRGCPNDGNLNWRGDY